MREWIETIKNVLDEGRERGDRTGTGTKSLFGVVSRFDLTEGFPLVTSKFTSFHSIKHELLWMLAGDTNIKYLKENRVSIWDEWVKPETAFLRPCTVDEVLKLAKAKEDFNYGQAIDVFEQMIGTHYGQPFYTPQVDDISPEGRVKIILPRPSGNELNDTIEKMRALLNFLIENPISNTPADNLDQLARVTGIGKLQENLIWRRRVHELGTWETPDHRVLFWPFEIIEGDLGPVYGKQLVRWQPGIDPEKLKEVIDDLPLSRYDEIPQIIEAMTPKPINQIENVINLIKNSPESRRIYLSMWNPAELDEMALMPCHISCQFYSEENVANDGNGKRLLSAMVYMRKHCCALVA